MENQISNRILMVRPATFFFNAETAKNNSFQTAPTVTDEKSEIHTKAIQEFNNLVTFLREVGVTVEVIEEDSEPFCSDSVFPNNWLSFHVEVESATSADSTGELLPEESHLESVNRTAILYPMWSLNRQQERKKLSTTALKLLPEETSVLDLSPLEKAARFLEGTGSLVLDRVNKIAYACLSPRTSKDAVELFCKRMSYKAVVFQGFSAGQEIYHTNVMMSVADKYAVICLEAIIDLGERVDVEVMLKNLGKVLIPISLQQMNEFAGNCLQLRGKHGTFLVMSSRAFKALTEEQIDMIGQFDKILHAEVGTIEKFGGGSVRCMICEIGDNLAN